MTRFESYSLLGAFTLCVAATPTAVGQTLQDHFFCQLDEPGRPVMTVRVVGSELVVAGPDLKAKHLQSLQITDGAYEVHDTRPLFSDGTGTFSSFVTINRVTGAFSQGFHAVPPAGSSKPRLDRKDNGRCWLDNAPGAGESIAQKGAESPDSSPLHGNATGTPTAADSAADDQNRPEAERQQQETAVQGATAAARQQREEDARVAREKVEAERVHHEEEARVAQQKAEAERKRREEDARLARERAQAQEKQSAEQQRRREEQGLRNSFSGHATTCPGGGAGVLYLQTSRPFKNGCNVRFEARCPGTPSGNGVTISQYNYIGGSCFGIGDLIRIGQMNCPADQVQISMTSASCG